MNKNPHQNKSFLPTSNAVEPTPEIAVADQSQIKSAHFWKNLNQLGFMMAIAIMIGIVPGTMLISQGSSPAQQLEAFPMEAESNSDEEICLDNGGVEWKEFSNSCADNCSQYTQEQLCSQLITYGCDCGPDSCWNGTQCINNPTSVFISDKHKLPDEL